VKKGYILDGRSNKSKEKYADHLMKVSNTLFTSFLLSISVVPLTMIVQFAFKNKDKVLPSFHETLKNIGWVSYPMFIFIVLTLLLSFLASKSAMDIYDNLDAKENKDI